MRRWVALCAAAFEGWARTPRAVAGRLAYPGLVWNERVGSEMVAAGKSTWRR